MVGTEATHRSPRHGDSCQRCPRISAALIWLAICLQVVVAKPTLLGQEPTAKRAALLSQEPVPPSAHPLRARGDIVHRWKLGEADAYLLAGKCELQHEGKRFLADDILLVVDGVAGNIRSRIVMSGVMTGEASKNSRPIAAVEYTTTEPEVAAPVFRAAPDQPTPLLNYLPERDSSPPILPPIADIRPVQYSESIPPGEPIPYGNSVLEPSAGLPAPPPITFSDGATTGGFQFFVGGGSRAVEFVARGRESPPRLENVNRPEAGETVVVARGGVTVLIRDVSAQLPGGELLSLGTVSLSADRVVGWLPLFQDLFSGNADVAQSEGELYLEGDIVFRQGDRIVYADAMYYNVTREFGIVLDAEAITTIPEYQGVVRLKADVLQQISRGNFVAFDAAVTSSRMGIPKYWLQSGQLQLTDRQRIVTSDVTGLPTVDRVPFASSSNNFVYFGGVPILYWPRFSTPLEKPSFYLTGAKIKNDDILGTQLLLQWDVFQLLGLENPPEGVEAIFSTDYLSDRGFAFGSRTRYDLPSIFGIPGPVIGFYDSWFLPDDHGLDTLGGNRKNLVPETTRRGRVLLRHRHYLPGDYEFIAEVGYLSDRDFLEQFLENEWDQFKDMDTAARLRKYRGNQLFDFSASVRVNDFFMDTEHLPRFDHYTLGNSWFGDRLTWSAHNKLGYTRLRVADPPTNPVELADYSTLPGEIESAGIEAGTRQELAMPIQAGPVKLVPFLSGEAVQYGEAADLEPLTRLTGQAGIRANLPMSRVDPSVQSSLLNVRGLAHKVDWTAEYFYADSNADIDDLPYYDPLDDNSQEQFRRRFINSDYGGTLPPQFDPRFFAFRQGIQRNVVSASDVVAADLQQLRLGIHQRLQTKRGLPGQERITDLLQFDVDTILFPEAGRDNFGETLGPTTYEMLYHFGDRVAFISDGYFDSFGDGLRSISAGLRTSRPGLGDVYVGVLSLEGPISSTVLRSTLDYRLNEKWIITAANVYDLGEVGNVGQVLGLTRIGESFLFQIRGTVDSGRDNTGIAFTIEPRFWPSPRLGRIGGRLVPPPGVEGLE